MPYKHGKSTHQGKENITKSARFIFMVVFNKTVIPLMLLGYEMIMANLALRTSLSICHLV